MVIPEHSLVTTSTELTRLRIYVQVYPQCSLSFQIPTEMLWPFLVYVLRDVILPMSGPVAQSVKRLGTGWTVRGSNSGGGEIFRTCPDRPWGPASLLYNGYRVFPGGKERPGRDADPSPPYSAVVKKEQS